jgi:hypothetical protein
MPNAGFGSSNGAIDLCNAIAQQQQQQQAKSGGFFRLKLNEINKKLFF